MRVKRNALRAAAIIGVLCGFPDIGLASNGDDARAALLETPQVAGGTAVVAGQFPFLVVVLGEVSACTGSLIASRWVLTAAHCAIPGLPDTVIVSDAMPGTAGPGHTVEALSVKRWIPHPGFDGSLPAGSIGDDIALIELFDDATMNPPRVDGVPLYTPQPIELAGAPSDTSSSLGDMLLAGFGLTDLDILPSVALWASAPSFPAASCTSIINARRQLCYGTYPRSCRGDSGGAVFQASGSSFLQYGVVSIGPGGVCGPTSRNSIATYVPHYRPWIEGVLASGPGPNPTPTPILARTPRPPFETPNPIRLGWELPPRRADGVASGVSNAQGWVFSTAGEIASIELFIDGEKEATLPCCSERADAPGPELSGFSGAINWGRFDGGNHQAKLVVKDSRGNERTEARSIKTVKVLPGVNFARDLSADDASCSWTASDTFECTGLDFRQGLCAGKTTFKWSNAKQAMEIEKGCRPAATPRPAAPENPTSLQASRWRLPGAPGK